MAEQHLDVRFVKSSQWRAVFATGAATNAIGGPLGLEFHMRFTYEWTDVEREVLIGEAIGPDISHGIKVTAPSQYFQTPLYKIEEVAVRMPTDGMVALISSLLTQLAQLQGPFGTSDEQKRRIVDAYAAFQKN